MYIWHTLLCLQYGCLQNKHLIRLQTYLQVMFVCKRTTCQTTKEVFFLPQGSWRYCWKRWRGKKFRGILSDKHKQQVWEDIAQKWRILGKDKERDDRTFHENNLWRHKHCPILPEIKKKTLNRDFPHGIKDTIDFMSSVLL